MRLLGDSEKVRSGSGDLAPLSHLALVVIGEGEAFFAGERLPAAEALSRAGLRRCSWSQRRTGLAERYPGNVLGRSPGTSSSTTRRAFS